ncbi:Crp/Fnr family transcriptional regulator [Diaphorobacter caeni]|uniref:Crp/Fnr family transcriptional regulator n=1 Tax=Diaphorobacter caeni TaxID=2784387 RepID=UPI00189088AE|nr:Crp/Fnr family transcriptional regulator [Diaphorobacter caeni]MBF5004721.1 Crp/Fnr family transcriptional regulator [Diaphorobacter caeni]
MTTYPEPMGNLPANVARQFLAASSRRLLSKGEQLFGLGSAPRAMFVVLTGRLQVSILSEEGRQFFASFLPPGHWFGEIPLLDEGARAFYAEAVEPSEVAVLAAQDFWQIVNSDPAAMLAVMRLSCSRFRAAVAWIEDASLHPFNVRLASRLLSLSAMGGEEQGALRISQEMLAAQLGSARQTVNRQLQAWSQQRLIQLRYGTIELLDIAALRRIAKR